MYTLKECFSVFVFSRKRVSVGKESMQCVFCDVDGKECERSLLRSSCVEMSIDIHTNHLLSMC